MKISISGQHIKIGQSLTEHAEEALNTGIKKYFENAISADVVFSRETHNFVCDIVVNEGSGNHIFYKSKGKEDSIYAAFDKALDRMEKQLRRYKKRIRDHSKLNLAEATSIAARKYVIQDDGQDIEADDSAPLIIAEKATPVEALSVADAVMRMNLANLPALMFINKKTGNYSVVYKREDGNISWVEAEKEVKATIAAA